jgi:hypothetical protein
MQGFETTHVGVLKDEDVCRALNKVLGAAPAPLPAGAPVK